MASANTFYAMLNGEGVIHKIAPKQKKAQFEEHPADILKKNTLVNYLCKGACSPCETCELAADSKNDCGCQYGRRWLEIKKGASDAK